MSGTIDNIASLVAYQDWQNEQLRATLASPFRGINAPIPGLTGAPGTFHPAAVKGSFACGALSVFIRDGAVFVPDRGKRLDHLQRLGGAW